MTRERTERAPSEGRVLAYIKNRLAGDDTGERILVELLGIKSISTNLTMTGTGTATFVLANHKSSCIRFISRDTVDANSKREGYARVNTLSKEYFSQIMKDPDGFYSDLWKDTVVNRGDKELFRGQSLIQRSRSRGDLVPDKTDTGFLGIDAVKSTKDQIIDKLPLKKGQTSPGKANDGGLMHTLPLVDWFDPVWVDWRGQDGYWYAGFTGVITNIGDAYSRGGDQSLTIQCKDYTALLDNTSLVSAWNRLSKVESESPLLSFIKASEANIAAGKSSYENIFGKENKIKDIIGKVIKVSQDMWQLPDTSNTYGVKDVGYHLNSKRDQAQIYAYEGVSARRESLALTIAKYSVLDKVTKKTYPDGSTYDYRYVDIKPDTYKTDFKIDPYDYLYNNLVFIDPLLYNMDNIFIHKLLNNDLALFKDSMKSGDGILNDLAAKMLAYKYQDANGNLIFEVPKYNALPNYNSYGGQGSATVIRHKKAKSSVDNKVLDSVEPEKTISLEVNTEGEASGLNENEEITWYATKYHGVNYILSTDDFRGFNTSRDESTLMTVASLQSIPSFLSNLDGDLVKASKFFNAVATSDLDDLSKLGVRRYQVQNLYNAKWKDADTTSRIYSHLCSAILERVNAQADSGTIQLQQRPDLQLGKTYLNPLRWKSYLIMGITNAWSPGSVQTTTLNVSYGHPMHKTLEMPWAPILAEPDVFMATEDLVNKVKGMTATGEPRPNSDLPTEPNATEFVTTNTTGPVASTEGSGI